MRNHIRPVYPIIAILLSCSREQPGAQPSPPDTFPPQCDYSCNNIDAPDDAVYVRAGASDGDGSKKHPLSTISAGIEAALEQESRTVIVKPGTYPEQLSLGPEHDGLSIIGTCAETVIIDGSDVSARAALAERASILVEDTAAHIEGLSIVGAAVGAMVSGRGDLTLRDIDISKSRTVGIFTYEQSDVLVQCSTIRDGDPQGSGRGLGLIAQQRADVTLEDSWLLRNPRISAFANSQARLSMERVEIRDTRLPDREGEVSSFEDDWHGKGVFTVDSTLSMTDCIVDNSAQAGIQIFGRRATLDGVTVSNTWTDEHHVFAAGLYASAATVTVTDSSFRSNDVANVIADGVFSSNGQLFGSDVTIAGSAICDGQPSVLGSFGVGILSSASSVTVQDSVLEDNLYAHILSTSVDDDIFDESDGVSIPRAELLIEDTAFGSVLPFSDVELEAYYRQAAAFVLELLDPDAGGVFLSGLSLLGEASQQNACGVLTTQSDVELYDVSMTGTMNDGLHLDHSVGSVEGLTVHDTVAWKGGIVQAGASVRLSGESTLVAADVQIENIDGNGVFVLDSALELTRASIVGTRNVDYGDVFGDGGVQGGGLVASGGDLWLADVTVRSAQHVGMNFVQSAAVLEDVTIEETERGRYTEGAGLSATGSQLTAARLTVEGTDGLGVVSIGGGALDCSDCAFNDNRFAGLIGNGTVTLEGAEVTGNLPHPNDGGGFGLLLTIENIPAAIQPVAGEGPHIEGIPDAQEAYDAGQGRITVTDSFIGAHEEAAIYLYVHPRSVGEGVYRFTDNTVESTALSLSDRVVWPEGNAFFVSRLPTVWDEEEEEGLIIEGGEIRGGGEAAIFLHGSTATIEGVEVSAGTGVFQQGFGDAAEPACEDLIPPLVIGGGFSVSRCPEYDEDVKLPQPSLVEADQALSD